MKLSELKTLQKAIVTAVNVDSAKVVQRLSDLGLRQGQKIICLQKSPVGGVTSYQLSHGVFALEDWITENIEVQQDRDP